MIILISLIGSCGAICRYYLDLWAKKYLHINSPFPTMGINIIASLLMGLSINLTTHTYLTTQLNDALSNGYCGGLSTFSTFSVDIITQLLTRKYFRTGLYLTGSIFFSALAFYLGTQISL